MKNHTRLMLFISSGGAYDQANNIKLIYFWALLLGYRACASRQLPFISTDLYSRLCSILILTFELTSLFNDEVRY